MPKLILKDFELTEISGVDRPAQPTATMAIMKRAVDEANKELINKQEPPVPEDNSNKEGAVDMPTIEELSKKVDDLTDALAKADALAKLTDAEKAFLEKRSDDDKKKFMDMDKEDREKEMKKAAADLAKNDETIEVDGATIRKSDVGESMFAVIKSQQAQLKEQRDAVKKAQDDAEMATLTKRASDEYSHVVGKPEDVAGVLKAMQAMPPSAKEALENILKAAEEMSATAFKAKGRSDASDVTKSVTEKLDELAKNYAKDNSVSYEVAYERVAMENAELYKQLINQ